MPHTTQVRMCLPGQQEARDSQATGAGDKLVLPSHSHSVLLHLEDGMRQGGPGGGHLDGSPASCCPLTRPLHSLPLARTFHPLPLGQAPRPPAPWPHEISWPGAGVAAQEALSHSHCQQRGGRPAPITPPTPAPPALSPAPCPWLLAQDQASPAP